MSPPGSSKTLLPLVIPAWPPPRGRSPLARGRPPAPPPAPDRPRQTASGRGAYSRAEDQSDPSARKARRTDSSGIRSHLVTFGYLHAHAHARRHLLVARHLGLQAGGAALLAVRRRLCRPRPLRQLARLRPHRPHLRLRDQSRQGTGHIPAPRTNQTDCALTCRAYSRAEDQSDLTAPSPAGHIPAPRTNQTDCALTCRASRQVRSCACSALAVARASRPARSRACSALAAVRSAVAPATSRSDSVACATAA
eukprot:4327479-Pyramimonas_sp.AAC.1